MPERFCRSLLFISTVAILVCTMACKGEETPIKPLPHETLENGNPLTLGLVPEVNIFEQRKRYLPLVDYLSRKIGRKVKLKIISSYRNVVRDIDNHKLDMAFVGSLDYVISHSVSGSKIVARPQWKNGVSQYKGYIFARKDSGVTSDVASWKGKDVALVHLFTMAGDTFPRYWLKKNGADSLDDFFNKIMYTGSHDASVMAVFKGDAHIGAAKGLIFDQMAAENPELKANLVILAESEPVPSNGLVVCNQVDEETIDDLKSVLLKMNSDLEGREVLDKFGAEMFLETGDSDYEALYDMLKEVGTSPEYLFKLGKKQEIAE